jgi:very-short-patch-repair endonuclease
MPASEKMRNHARDLRRQQTEVELRLWSRLRDRQLCGAKFRRQHPIGPYIVDFCCPERALIVEVDGGQHAEGSTGDQRRTNFLEANGFHVVRFWNNEVLEQTDAVLEEIVRLLGQPSPFPLPKRARVGKFRLRL